MEEYLRFYGGLPKVVSEVDIDTERVEMCFVQYLPIFIPHSADTIKDFRIPDNIAWTRPIVDRCTLDFGFQYDRYLYLTVKKGFNINRHGWHCDGFGTDDINYLWSDFGSTQFLNVNRSIKLPRDHTKSLEVMERLSYTVDYPYENSFVEYPNNTILKLNQSQIHRVNPAYMEKLRTFVKVSISDDKYNLEGNAHNYLLDYKWEMKERLEERNHPVVL